MRRGVGVFTALCFLLIAQIGEGATYLVDKHHTTVEFSVRHLFTKVKGHFTEFEGSFQFDPEDPNSWEAHGEIEAGSINTNVAPRDKHLRSKDFFYVDEYPKITFQSTKASEVTPEGGKLHGLLTIRGVQQPVVLEVEIHGIGTDPWGTTRLGATATLEIDRKEYGLNWNETLETGGVLVGDEVKITLELEGILQE